MNTIKSSQADKYGFISNLDDCTFSFRYAEDDSGLSMGMLAIIPPKGRRIGLTVGDKIRKSFAEHDALNAVAEAARLIEGCSEIRPNETPGGYKRRILEPVMEALKNLQSIRTKS